MRIAALHRPPGRVLETPRDHSVAQIRRSVVRDVNIAAGTFQWDGYLWFRWEGDAVGSGPMEFVVPNGSIEKIDEVLHSIWRARQHMSHRDGILDLRIQDSSRHYLFILYWLGFSTTAIEYEHAERFSGDCSYTFRKLLRHALPLRFVRHLPGSRQDIFLHVPRIARLRQHAGELPIRENVLQRELRPRLAPELARQLAAQLQRIDAEGIEARWARHAAMAQRTWSWVGEMREETAESWAGPSVGIYTPEMARHIPGPTAAGAVISNTQPP